MTRTENAVLFLVFNRPDTTSRVFDAIRDVRPPRLYVAADGARPSSDGERERVAKVREIATNVDWPCQVKTLFRDDNLGCKGAVSGAITWFFEQEEQGIILEDDCLPHPDFFMFCDALLDLYSNYEKLLVVTGGNHQDGRRRGDGSYYFSKYNHCWGWASWRRAWAQFDGDVAFWPEWRESTDWVKKTPDDVERAYWVKILNRVHANEIDSWAYPWTASAWYYGGLTATPNVNLVSNIGFGGHATHTRSARSHLASMPVRAIGELVHPTTRDQDVEADRYTFDYHYGGRNLRLPRSLLRLPLRAGSVVYRRLKRAMA